MASILLVDDHPDVREVVGQMLELHGHTVALAESGELAWEQMQVTPPDALVVDQRLPGMTGIELLQRMLKSPILSKVARILCSGDDRERDAAERAGADFWLKGSDRMFDEVAKLGEKLKDSGFRVQGSSQTLASEP